MSHLRSILRVENELPPGSGVACPLERLWWEVVGTASSSKQFGLLQKTGQVLGLVSLGSIEKTHFTPSWHQNKAQGCAEPPSCFSSMGEQLGGPHPRGLSPQLSPAPLSVGAGGQAGDPLPSFYCLPCAASVPCPPCSAEAGRLLGAWWLPKGATAEPWACATRCLPCNQSLSSFFPPSLRLPPSRCRRQDLQPDDGAVPVQGRRDRPHLQPLRQGLPAEPLARGPLHQ